jgi:hypothetical protein
MGELAQMGDVIVTAVMTGLVSTLGTIAALKVDIKWAHAKADSAHHRLDKLDEIMRGVK